MCDIAEEKNTRFLQKGNANAHLEKLARERGGCFGSVLYASLLAVGALWVLLSPVSKSVHLQLFWLAWANVDLMGAHCGIVEKATACTVTGSGLCDECEQLQQQRHLTIMGNPFVGFMNSLYGDAHRKVKFCYTKWLSWACTAQRVSVCFGHNLSIKRSPSL